MSTTAVPTEIFVKEYLSSVDTAQLLREERALLLRVAQFYGPLPCGYREWTGGPPEDDPERPDVTSLYDAVHQRLTEVDAALRELEHDCACDVPHATPVECASHKAELAREGERQAHASRGRSYPEDRSGLPTGCGHCLRRINGQTRASCPSHGDEWEVG